MPKHKLTDWFKLKDESNLVVIEDEERAESHSPKRAKLKAAITDPGQKKKLKSKSGRTAKASAEKHETDTELRASSDRIDEWGSFDRSRLTVTDVNLLAKTSRGATKPYHKRRKATT